MKFKITKTKMLDGREVFDVDLFANGREEITKRRMCIFTCGTKEKAEKFFDELEKLVSEHTEEILELAPFSATYDLRNME